MLLFHEHLLLYHLRVRPLDDPKRVLLIDRHSLVPDSKIIEGRHFEQAVNVNPVLLEGKYGSKQGEADVFVVYDVDFHGLFLAVFSHVGVDSVYHQTI